VISLNLAMQYDLETVKILGITIIILLSLWGGGGGQERLLY
jgi:hypothetical protein